MVSMAGSRVRRRGAALMLGVMVAACGASPTATTTGGTSEPTTAAEPVEDLVGELPEAAEVVEVVSITDGDTIEVADGSGALATVRLIGINAPESGECFADEATRVLGALVPV